LALKEDPNFGQAMAGLAMAIHSSHLTKARMNREISENSISMYRDTLFQLVEKALTLDPNLEEAYLVRGHYYTYIRDFNRALQDYNRALKINPNCSMAWDAKSDIEFNVKSNWIKGLSSKLKAVELERGESQLGLLAELGDFYEHMGFTEKAEDVYLQTLRTTGDSAAYYLKMAGSAYCNLDWHKRIYFMKKSLELDPDQIWPLVNLSDSYRKLGNSDSANYFAFLLQEKETAALEVGGLEFFIGQALMNKGRIEEAQQMMDKLETYMMSLLQSDLGHRDAYLLNLFQVCNSRDQYARAMDYLKQIDENSLKPNWFIIELEHSPYQEIQADPDYQRILKTLKSTWQTERVKVKLWMENNDMLLDS
jgi:tetratricopeptide (TPR) repeat protein